MADGEFDAPLEVISVGALGQSLDEGRLVAGTDEIDADRLSACVDHLFGEFVDVPVVIDRVFDLLVAYCRSVDTDEGRVRFHQIADLFEYLWIEDNISVHPQDATLCRESKSLQQAAIGVCLVVGLVVDVGDIGKGFENEIEFEANHGGDAHIGSEDLLQIVDLLLHDRAPVTQRGEWLRERSSEACPHAGRENHRLNHDAVPSLTVRMRLNDCRA